ncbi:MAG: hypothetical protein M3081_10680 [Gemmatimonadota bacterium]|nr:hypothetical protein [Gemmatimonadota bacterium]
MSISSPPLSGRSRNWRTSSLGFAALLAGTALADVGVARAQLARGDTLIQLGRIAAAESLYYETVRAHPRDPTARLTLGWYLASRGRLRIAATLMEEARFFGSDPALVAEQLIPVYTRLGEYNALSDLPSSRQAPAERARASWLAVNLPFTAGPDSADVPWRVGDNRTVGKVALVIGRDTVIARIDPTAENLVLDTVWARRKEVRRFASRGAEDARHVAGVTSQVMLGAFTLNNVPTSFAVMKEAGTATIGLDLLGRYAPTFDSTNAKMTLRKNGVYDDPRAEHVPTLTYRTGIWLVGPTRTLPVGSPEAARLLGNRRWTLDARRGEIAAKP